MLWLSAEALSCCQSLGRVSRCCWIHSEPEAKEKESWVDCVD